MKDEGLGEGEVYEVMLLLYVFMNANKLDSHILRGKLNVLVKVSYLKCSIITG